jgi:hypothetical protein
MVRGHIFYFFAVIDNTDNMTMSVGFLEEVSDVVG